MIGSSVHKSVNLSILRKAANLMLLLLVAALFSCHNEKDVKPPKGSIPQKQLVKILVEIHLLESNAENLMINKDSLLPELKVSYNELFAKNKITVQQFEETFSWYEQNPMKLDALYQEVVAELSKREAHAKAGQKKLPPAQAVVDSTSPPKFKKIGKE
jgi:hypothetical protein